MHWTLRWAEVCTASFLGLASTALPAAAETCDRTGTCGPDTRRYALAVRCNAAVVEDAETNDTLTVTAWNGGEFLGMMPWLGVICSRWYDPSRENAHFTVGDFNKRPTHFILETSGSDAFFADWIEISEITTDQWGGPKQETKIAQFGAPGGRGYCLSRDPNDHSGDWAAASDACDAAIELNVVDQAVYATTPTDLAQWLIALDCSHFALNRTAPWATVTIRVYDSAGKVIQQNSEERHRHYYPAATVWGQLDLALNCPSDETNWTRDDVQVHGLKQFVARDVAAIEVEVGPLGAFAYRLQNQEARLFIDQLMVTKDYIDVVHWGVNDGAGWCLQHDPDPQVTAWIGFTEGACYPGIRFDARTGQWSPLAAR